MTEYTLTFTKEEMDKVFDPRFRVWSFIEFMAAKLAKEFPDRAGKIREELTKSHEEWEQSKDPLISKTWMMRKGIFGDFHVRHSELAD
jgi:hypothetical protein